MRLNNQKDNKKLLSVNESITRTRVLLIDSDGQNKGETSLQEALDFARNLNLDLVQIKDLEDYAICKVMKYQSFTSRSYATQGKRSSDMVKVKTIKLSLFIGKNDLAYKINNIIRFLKKRLHVKVMLMIRGRQLLQKDKAIEMMSSIENSIELYGQVQTNKIGHNFVSLTISPK